MSTRISADSSAKRNLASARASSVFPDARRAAEDERADRPPRVLETGPAATNRPRDGRDGFLLADHRLVDLVLHAQEARGLRFLKPRHGNPRPAADDERDLLLAQLRPVRLAPLFPFFLLLANLALELALVVTQRRRPLEVLVADRGLLLVVHLLEVALERGHFRRRRLGRQPRARACFVDHVDGLVGQEAVRDVALGQLGGRRQREVRDRNLVVVLVFLAEALEDLDRLVDGRWFHDHGLEPTLERAVLLDVLAVLVQRGRADALQLAARQRGLEHVRGIDGALGRPSPYQRVQFVYEQDDVLVLRDLVHDRLEALLELTAIFGPCDHRGHVKRQHPVVPQGLGAFAVGDQLREAFDDGRLADAGFADEHRVVLLAACEHFHHALDFLGSADGRIELPFARQLREVAAEVIQRRRLGLLLAFLRRRRRRTGWLLSAARLSLNVGAKDAQRLRARGLEVHAGVGQHLRGDALLLAKQAQEQVLRADVAVSQLARFAHRQLEHLLGARCIGQIGARGLGSFPLLDRLLDLLLNLVEFDVEVLQNGRGHAFTLADEAKQDVLRPDVLVMEPGCFLPRHGEDFPDSLREVVAVHDALKFGIVRGVTRPTPDSFSRVVRTYRARARLVSLSESVRPSA